ncbi:hypothetical protein JAAARDRAFT_29918 [Jaapia argillacea MUCL 33604]|uniref:Rhodanese domain-containing protein n=1 Tax=Jaapia argillacea MUCL 33604 TaxID=933084 RepID=A0A067QMK8_9AGAM|nr:hypothetical protein JAAARDRAFT_29918 [Jaapia argillacea MUCL 33604]
MLSPIIRIAATRCTRPTARIVLAQRLVSPAPSFMVQQAVRTKVDDATKKLLEIRDELQKDWTAPILTYEQVKAKSNAPSPDAYIVDVREPDEVVQGSIPSSVNLPLSVIANSLHLDPVIFKEKHGFEKPKKDQELVFYCRSGKRSASASDVAKRNGYTNIFNYEGSWLDWVAKDGKPTSS